MSKYTDYYMMDILFELIKYELDMYEPEYNFKEIEEAVNSGMIISDDFYSTKNPIEVHALYSKFSDEIPWRSFWSILKDLDGNNLKLVYECDIPTKVKITSAGISNWKHYHNKI